MREGSRNDVVVFLDRALPASSQVGGVKLALQWLSPRFHLVMRGEMDQRVVPLLDKDVSASRAALMGTTFGFRIFDQETAVDEGEEWEEAARRVDEEFAFLPEVSAYLAKRHEGLLERFLDGERIDAEEALRRGLVDRVVYPGEPLYEVLTGTAAEKGRE